MHAFNFQFISGGVIKLSIKTLLDSKNFIATNFGRL